MRILFKIFSAAFFACVVLLGATTLYLTRTIDMNSVALRVEEAVTSATGLSCRLRGTPPLRFALWPVLSLQADNVVLLTPPDEQGVKHEVVSVGRVSASMEIMPLLSGNLEVDRILLERPVVNLAYASALTDVMAQPDDMEGPTLQGVPSGGGVSESKSPAVTGSAPGDSGDNATEKGSESGLLQRFKVDGLDIENGVVVHRPDDLEKGEDFLSVSGLQFSLDVAGVSPWSLEALVAYGRTKLSVKASGSVEREGFTVSSAQSIVAVNGDVDINGHLMPLKVNATPVFVPSSSLLNFPTLAVNLGGLGIDGQVLVTDAVSERWNATGDVRLSHFSLPFWFEFTENLPSSLNHALDDLNGRLKFVANAKGLWADDLRAEVLGMPLRGSGGIPEFARPAIVIDVTGDMVDVDKVFPEISENPPDVLPVPKYTGRPVLSEDPSTAEPVDPNDPGWGYDIRVKARNGTARGLTFKGLSFRCGPTEDNQDTYTSYDIDSFYGGNIKSVLTFREDMILDVTLSNISTDAPVRHLFKEEILGGLLNGKAHLASDASTVFGLVASMRGSIEAVITDGFVGTAGKRDAKGLQPMVKFPMKRMDLLLKGHGKGSDKTTKEDFWPYFWDGSLKYSLPDSSDAYEVSLKGPVWVETPSGMPKRTRNADFRYISRRFAKPFDAVVPVVDDLAGKLTCDLDLETLSIKGVQGTIAGAQVAGDVSATHLYGDTRWKGQGSVRTDSLEEFLAGLGVSLWEHKDPKAMGRVNVSGTFSQVHEVLELSEITATLDDTTLKGGLTYIQSDKPLWRFTASGDMLDLDRYLPPKAKEKHEVSTEPWDLEWLKRIDAAGELGFDTVVFRKLDIGDVRATVEVKNGVILASPVSASFYGGTANGMYRGDVADGLKSHIKVDLKDTNLEPAASAVFGDDYVGGKATAYFDATGLFRSAADWPAALKGVWGFEITDGYYRIASKKKPDEKSAAPDAQNTAKQGIVLQSEGAIPKERTSSFSGVDKDKRSWERDSGTARKKGDGRSSFSRATADGEILNGVLKNENLALRSLLMSMEGEGVINFVNDTMDYTVSVTYAEVPTFPVRIHGSLKSPETTIRQSQILPKTLNKLGGGIFSIFKGVLTTPFRLFDALGSAVGGDSEE